MNEYYSIEVKGKDFAGYLVWYTNEKDGLLMDGKKLKKFYTKDALYEYVKQAGFSFNGDWMVYDFGYLEDWLDLPDAEIECPYFLNIWNLFTDVFYSAGLIFSGDLDDGITTDVYNKLFYGCNLPALRGDGELYIPTWYEDEVELIASVLTEGLNLLRELLN